MKIRLDVAPGELVDKMTILEIKLERITGPDQLKNVRNEYSLIRETFRRCIPPSQELTRLMAALKRSNERLWVIEDEIRDCEREKDFGPKFIELARSVYRNNDQRARLKRDINTLLNSSIIEEKSYRSYE
jgi:hypothetical protein